jgi:hypothetical protein
MPISWNKENIHQLEVGRFEQMYHHRPGEQVRGSPRRSTDVSSETYSARLEVGGEGCGLYRIDA